jgi:hypothetical protein
MARKCCRCPLGQARVLAGSCRLNPPAASTIGEAAADGISRASAAALAHHGSLPWARVEYLGGAGFLARRHGAQVAAISVRVIPPRGDHRRPRNQCGGRSRRRRPGALSAERVQRRRMQGLKASEPSPLLDQLVVRWAAPRGGRAECTPRYSVRCGTRHEQAPPTGQNTLIPPP